MKQMSNNLRVLYLIEGVNQVGNIFTDTLKLETEKVTSVCVYFTGNNVTDLLVMNLLISLLM